ncbi:tRNA dihydrouridine synthase DusB [Sulfitobacter sp. BDSS02]|nr:tRNA dihydrouridine synthase DusB [Sulfitobacter sp. BDSS02]MBR9849444.1 tRNA dihydrouridine synthase DusB [Paracoccaceae bacterium]
MTFKLADKTLASPVLLAPMAGITDRPFRDLVTKFGAGIVVSEMVASQEMVQSKPGVRERAELSADIENTAVQLAGRETYWMAEAARQVAGFGAKVIDINMGCPAKKVTSGESGSALMKTPDHALRLIEAVVEAVDVPVTLKTRLGWDSSSLNAAHIAKRAQDAGVAMITIHGRTRCQFYKGTADWTAIRDVVNAVDVPVVANGDIVDFGSARTALAKSGADGVMIGRGAQGRPWVLAEVTHALGGTAGPVIPTGTDLVDLVSDHYQSMMGFYGRTLGVRVARKHLGWYMDHAGTRTDLRRMVLTEQDPESVVNLLGDALTTPAKVAA